MDHIFYSSERVANPPAGAKQLNPNHFTTPVEGVKKVTINGDYPKLRSAYEAQKGVTVEAYSPPAAAKAAPVAGKAAVAGAQSTK